METRTIQKVIEEKKYIASDGQEFDTEWKCRCHEEDLQVATAEQILKSVKRCGAVNEYDSRPEYDASCYYIQNKVEYDALVKYWFDENYNDGVEFYLDKPEADGWKFPLWVYVSGHEGYGEYVCRAEDYINGVKKHIRELEAAINQETGNGVQTENN